ncbi:MAG: cytochrome b/b6 domain-containing protein [Caldimonas sp.]
MSGEPAVVRVWDMPTRIFHWLLAACIVSSIVSARLGGSAMGWHFRFGYLAFTLLAFRLVWGFAGGHWSRFRAFVYAPATSLRYLRGTCLPHEHHHVGHNPLGAWSVIALLGVLGVQVATGLVADDEIASNGPLYTFVSSSLSQAASHWHKRYGQWIIIALVVVHVAVIACYLLRRRQNLVGAMLHGDKLLTADVPSSVDTASSRWLALAIFAACAMGVATVASLGNA